MSPKQTVVITGASAGVGRATVREFAREGARIALIARGHQALDSTRREVEDLGGEALVLPLDVADAEALERAAARIEDCWGPIDVWINNAMTSVFAPVKQMTWQEYKRVTEVTYLGYVYGTLCALKRMLKRNHGVIVQVSSALAYRSIPLQSAYCGAKHAILGFTESLRSELLHDRSQVKVTLVHLPAVNTPQFGWVRSKLPKKPQPISPIFQPEVAARAIHWASRHPRREITVGLSAVKAILADKIVPGLADHYLARKGYGFQQLPEPENPNRPDNLFHPIPGDPGAKGRFSRRAKDWSWQFQWIRYRGWWVLSFLGLAGLALHSSLEKKRSPKSYGEAA